MKTILSILMLTAVFAATALAQEVPAERDPFDAAEKRPPASSQAPVHSGEAWGRDPFNNPFANRVPVPARSQQGAEARGNGLTGIIYSKDVRLAIINGEAVREGNSIGGRKVASIGEQSVQLKTADGALEEVFLQNFSMRK